MLQEPRDMHQLRNATDLLGEARGRYFSDGFRRFNFHYENLHLMHQQLSADVSVTWDTGWIPGNRQMHVGAIEYIAIGCFICEHMLVYICEIADCQLADARISYCKMKICTSVMLQQGDKIRIQGKLINTTSTGQTTGRLLSTFEIAVGHVVLKVGVMHPAPHTKSKGAAVPFGINHLSLFSHGYKRRVHDIFEIICHEEDMTCSATVQTEELLTNRGFGALHHGILPTDLVSISGQLTQILLCRLENKRKEELSNIWLRELDIVFTIPNKINSKKKVAVGFKKFKQVKINKEWWRAVDLEVGLSEAKAKFKIAYKSNCSEN